jgi:peptidylprolyl isomerase
MPRRLLAFVAVLAFATACGSSGGSSAPSGPSGTPAPSGPVGQLPTVSGTFGTKPTISFPDGLPSTTLQKSLLKPGNGAVVKTGDLLVVNYLGQVWRSPKDFDNSYDHHTAVGFPIGTGKVIKGWDSALVGLHAGTRALLVIPPELGYGSAGNTQAGIKGTDTLVFVIDVIASYAAKSGGDPHAVPVHQQNGLPKVTGALGKQPKVTIPSGTKVPSALHTILLARGHGAAVKKGLVIVQYVAVQWSGATAGSTWTEGAGSPAAAPIGDPANPTPFDDLVGLPIGSRVLIEVPAKTGASPSTADAVAVDIVAQPTA